MESRFRPIGAVGVLLMASALALPWAEVGPAAQAVEPLSGFGRGIEVVLILAGVGALALWFDNRPVAFWTACLAGLWTALVMQQLPGSLAGTGGIGIAQMSWGAFLAFTGSVVLAIAAVARPRHSDIRATTPTA
jgi:hypothetical protein